MSIGLVRARDLERDGFMERELRPAEHGDELLTRESEIGSHDRAGQPRPGLRAAVGPSRLGVFEDAGVKARRCFAFGAGPRAGGKRLAGHRTSPGSEGSGVRVGVALVRVCFLKNAGLVIRQ